jgi:hypothetical protein
MTPKSRCLGDGSNERALAIEAFRGDSGIRCSSTVKMPPEPQAGGEWRQLPREEGVEGPSKDHR